MAPLSFLIDRFLDRVPFPSPLWALAPFAVATGLVMLVVFRFTSDQEAIRRTKNLIKAHFLELWLFRDDLRTIVSAQWQILRLNGRYLGLTVKPTLVLIIPVALILISLDGWFGSRPLRPGEAAIVTAQTANGSLALLEVASLESNGALTVETPPLRILQEKEVSWRIRAGTPGIHTVSLIASDRRFDKQVVVSDGQARITPSRLSSAFWQALLHPGEPSIPGQAGVQRIDVQYPPSFVRVFGWDVHWMVVFFALSIVTALAFKRILGVQL